MNVQIFNNRLFGKVRTIEENGKVLFCGSDVAKSLGYARPNDAMKQHCKGATVKHSITDSLGRNQRMNFITESDVFRLTTKSELPQAEKFESWIFDDVLPTIRKTGGYVNNEQTFVDTYLPYADEYTKQMFKTTLQTVRKLNSTVSQQHQLIGELKPKADYTDKILQNKSLVNVTQIAKDYGMSGQAFNKLLHSLGVQYQIGGQWLLYSKHQSNGYAHSETIDITHADGRKDTKMRTKWTQKGRLFLYELLKKNGYLPVIEQ